MSKGKEYYKQKIIDESPVMFFAATNTAMMEYPYILGRPEEKSPTLSEQADTYIMDSGIGSDSITDSKIIDAANSVNADIVVPKDVIGDPEQTTENIYDMVVSNPEKTFCIPTQSTDGVTHSDHYYQLKDILSTVGVDITDHWVAVGGIKDDSVEEQILTVAEFSNTIDDSTHVHAFGCGVQNDWVVAIRRWNDILDSFDTSSVYQYVSNGTVFDSTLAKHDHKLPRGYNSTCLSAMQRETLLYMFNHMLTESIKDDDARETFESAKLAEVFDRYVS